MIDSFLWLYRPYTVSDWISSVLPNWMDEAVALSELPSLPGDERLYPADVFAALLPVFGYTYPADLDSLAREIVRYAEMF